MQQKDDKKILWHTLAFMAFSTVWGFGNVINGFSEYGGLKAIVSWILIFAIYFCALCPDGGRAGIHLQACRRRGQLLDS